MKWLMLSLIVVLSCMTAAPVLAAGVDGASGPWADEVVGFSQGKTVSSEDIVPEFSDSSQALGVEDGMYVSLGFGGVIELRFDENVAITSRANIVESNSVGDDGESVAVYMSKDKVNWYFAGNEMRSGRVSLPAELDCAVYVRLVDISDPEEQPAIANGYDVDAVEAVDGGFCESLVPIPTPTPVISQASSTEVVAESNKPSTDAGPNIAVVKNGPSCTELNFSVEAELSDTEGSLQDRLVYFRYNGKELTATTNEAGKARVIFEYSGEGDLQAESSGFNVQTGHIDTLNCETSSTSTSAGDKVLGATTERLAATGSRGYVQLYLVTAAVTSGLAYAWLGRSSRS